MAEKALRKNGTKDEEGTKTKDRKIDMSDQDFDKYSFNEYG